MRHVVHEKKRMKELSIWKYFKTLKPYTEETLSVLLQNPSSIAKHVFHSQARLPYPSN